MILRQTNPEHSVSMLIYKYSRLILLLIVIVTMSILRPTQFLTFSNFFTVITSQAPYLFIISCSMTLAILISGIDLSIGSVLALSSCVGGYYIVKGHIVFGMITALIIGALIGLVNGLLISQLNLHPFLATYGMNWIARGLAYTFMGGQMFYLFPEKFRLISTAQIGDISISLLIAAVVFAVLWFFTMRTTFGREMYMVGRNADAARMAGVNNTRIVIVVFITSGILAAFTGLLFVARLNAAEATIGSSFNLMTIAATLVGGTQFGGGKGSVARTVLGVLIVLFIQNGLNILNVSSLWQDVVIGIVIILSVLIERVGAYLNDRAIERAAQVQ